MKNKVLSLATVFILTGVTYSCVQDDDYSTPENSLVIPCEDPELTADLSVEGLKDLAQSNASEIINDNIVKAYVVSSDANGNFYKNLSAVSADGTKGFQFNLDQEDLATFYEPGREIYIKTKDLWIGNANSMTEIGGEYNGGVGRLSAGLIDDHLIRGCETKEETDLVQTKQTIEVSNEDLNTLIEFTNIQFVEASLSSTFYDENNVLGGATNHTIEDESGNTIVVRTGQFADFSEAAIPNGSGTIRGILTKFGSTFQFIVRKIEDVNLTGERFVIDNSNECDSVIIPTGTIPFSDTFDTSLSSDWTLVKSFGQRDWDHKTFAGNGYVQMSSYNSDEENVAWMISPKFDFDAQANETLTFKSKDGFNNGDVLKVMYSMDYDGSDCPENFTWTELTATLSTGNTSGYGSDFVSSGNVDLSTLTGMATVAFVYRGSGVGNTLTTTMQIDDVTIGNGTTTATTLYENMFEGTNAPIDWTYTMEVGTKEWIHKTFSGNSYMQMSAYQADPVNKAWMISPALNMDTLTNEMLTFKSKDAFNNGNPVKVYYSTNYDGGTSPQSATWTELTANIATGSNSGYASDFTNSGNVDLSSVSGTAYIAFVYEGGSTSGITTTIQIDDFKVVGNN